MIALILQYIYTLLGWSFWNGGCELLRSTVGYLQRSAAQDGGWEDIQVFDRKPAAAIPEVYGFMRKKSDLKAP